MNDEPRIVKSWPSRILPGMAALSSPYRLVFTGVTYELQLRGGNGWQANNHDFLTLAKLVDSDHDHPLIAPTR